MTNPGRQLPPFEPFEVRRPQSFLESMHRLVRVGFPLLLWGWSVVAAVVLLRSWPQDHDLIVSLVVLLALALIFTVVAVRRFVYWRVDQAGIQQRCLGMRNWDLPWSAIVSRNAGPSKNRWLILFPFLIFPIAGGPYQAIFLRDRTGRKRKFNRLATNGDRLDALVRRYLNPTKEAGLARRHVRVMQAAEARYERQETVYAPLHRVTPDTPVVRLPAKTNESPELPMVCCNCLGPATKWGWIYASPGLLGFFAPRRLLLPLCADCHRRTRRGPGGLYGGVVAGVMVFIMVITALVVPPSERVAALVGMGVFLCPIGLMGLVVGWRGMRRPALGKLVQVVELDLREGWMEMRFGNQDYARLVAESGPRKGTKNGAGL